MKSIMLSHGDGGQLTQDLIEQIFQPWLNDPILQEQHDASIIQVPTQHLAVSTDTFVIQPIEFPGGDIGKLAVAGTVNDIAVSGAKPVFLTVGFVLEEGLEIKVLQRIVRSIANTAKEAGVRIIAGDTKVVERGKCGGIIINTTGIGYLKQVGQLGCAQIKPGDRVIINGGIAEHAVAVLAQRTGFEFSTPVLSDCGPLSRFIERLLTQFHTIRFLTDPTRGGVATALKEVIVQLPNMDIILNEAQIPIRSTVQGALEMMGMDPLYMANEGKVLIVAAEEEAARIVDFIRDIPGHELASEIGTVREGTGRLLLRTSMGGTRELGRMSGSPLPRIC
jgi:hydrogenase expression/formation protein HypE